MSHPVWIIDNVVFLARLAVVWLVHLRSFLVSLVLIDDSADVSDFLRPVRTVQDEKHNGQDKEVDAHDEVLPKKPANVELVVIVGTTKD